MKPQKVKVVTATREWPWFVGCGMSMWLAACCGYQAAIYNNKRNIELARCYDATMNHIGDPLKYCKAETMSPVGQDWTDY